MVNVSSSLGTYRIKAVSERSIAIKFSCALLLAGKLNPFSGKHEVLTVDSASQYVEFRLWRQKKNEKWEPELECVKMLCKDNVAMDFTQFTDTAVTETNSESQPPTEALPTVPISVPALPSGVVNCASDLLENLQSLWGHSSFRPVQEKAIDSVVTQNHTFVLMPTGGGKSLVFQLPGICDHRYTIVVSPLIALINDQVRDLYSKGIGAESFTGETGDIRRQQILFQLRSAAPELKFVYTTPETLRNDVVFRETVKSLGSKNQISYLVFDEAHCISQWGNGFRPDYLSIAEESRSIAPKATIVLLSATATPEVISDITQAVGLDNLNLVVDHFDRPNLKFEVHEKDKESNNKIIEIMSSAESGLVYCSTKRECEETSALLEAAGISSQPYHAGLSKTVKESLQENWFRESIKILCCTSAFGMGINKPNVRIVLFHSLPSSLEELFQGWGRAGRNGLPASCHLYFSFADRIVHIRNICDQVNYDSQATSAAMIKFQKVMDFVMSKTCCRIKLISYFNPQEATVTVCNNCSRCEKPVAEAASFVDYTPHITQIISFLQVCTERSMTVKYLAQVLSGRCNKKVKANGDESSSIFRIFKCTVKESELFLRHVITKDILREVPPSRGSSNCSYLQLQVGSQYIKYLSGQDKLMYHLL